MHSLGGVGSGFRNLALDAVMFMRLKRPETDCRCWTVTRALARIFPTLFFAFLAFMCKRRPETFIERYGAVPKNFFFWRFAYSFANLGSGVHCHGRCIGIERCICVYWANGHGRAVFG